MSSAPFATEQSPEPPKERPSKSATAETNKGNGIGLEFLVAVAAIVLILAGLHASRDIFAPFLLAVFFAMILMPPLQWLKKKGLSDWGALFTLSGIVTAFGLAVSLIVCNSLAGFAEKLPDYRQKMMAGMTVFDDWSNAVMDKFDVVEESIPRWSTPPEASPEVPEIDPALELIAEPTNTAEAGQALEKQKTEADMNATAEKPVPQDNFSLKNVIQVDSLLGYAQLAVTESLNLATVSFLVAILVIFMLIEAARMPGKLREAFAGRDLTNEYFNKIAEDTWNYMKIKTILMINSRHFGCFTTN